MAWFYLRAQSGHFTLKVSKSLKPENQAQTDDRELATTKCYDRYFNVNQAIDTMSCDTLQHIRQIANHRTHLEWAIIDLR